MIRPPGQALCPSRFRLLALAASLLALAACSTETVEQQSSKQTNPVRFDPLAWRPPADSEIPRDSLGASIRRGLALVTHTADSLPSYAPGNISCANCHLDGGRNADAAPLTGSHARFPKYLERTGAVIGLADRVNYCFTRSLAGNRLPVESREMQDILAYIAWLSRGVPVGEGDKLPGASGLASMPQLTGGQARGAQVYEKWCAACHRPSGEGNRELHPPVPALWGARSFSVGASMTRQSKAASFIWHNMPFGAGKTLTPQQAYDVAAYISAQARPDSPGKERDWPFGGAPADVPYATVGRAAHQPPPVLPRANPAATLVPPPAPAATKRASSR